MKKLIIIGALLAFSGCAWMGQQLDYQALCAADPACLQDAKNKAEVFKQVAGTFNPIAGGAAGAATLALFLWLGGKKKKEQQ